MIVVVQIAKNGNSHFTANIEKLNEELLVAARSLSDLTV